MSDIEDKISLEIAFKSRKLPPMISHLIYLLSIWIKIYTCDLKLYQCIIASILVIIWFLKFIFSSICMIFLSHLDSFLCDFIFWNIYIVRLKDDWFVFEWKCKHDGQFWLNWGSSDKAIYFRLDEMQSPDLESAFFDGTSSRHRARLQTILSREAGILETARKHYRSIARSLARWV